MHRIVVYGSFQQTQDELFDLSHLKEKMLQYVDPVTLNQLKDAAINIFEKKLSFALSEMFSVELQFRIHALLKWFYNINKWRFVEINTLTKQKYQKNHPIDWYQTKRVICDYKKTVSYSFGPLNEEITFYDFVVEKENLFLRNV